MEELKIAAVVSLFGLAMGLIGDRVFSIIIYFLVVG